MYVICADYSASSWLQSSITGSLRPTGATHSPDIIYIYSLAWWEGAHSNLRCEESKQFFVVVVVVVVWVT